MMGTSQTEMAAAKVGNNFEGTGHIDMEAQHANDKRLIIDGNK